MADYKTEQNAIIEVIKMYQNYPHLWDSSHTLHNNKYLRKQAWQAMLEKWKMVYDFATIKSLKKTIDSFKMYFKREWKKVQNSKRKGDDVYKPTIWYYKYFTFLYEEQIEEEPLTTIEIDTDTDEEVPEYETEIERNNQCLKNLQKKQTQPNSVSEDLTEDLTEDDSIDSFAVAMGFQLKEMSEIQKSIAEKLISDVMFHGNLEQLTSHSNINLRSDRSNYYAEPSHSSSPIMNNNP